MHIVDTITPKSPFHNRMYFGQSGTGKTHHFTKYLLEFKRFYPDNEIRKILIFSPKFTTEHKKIQDFYKEKVEYYADFDENVSKAFEDHTSNSVCIIVIDDLACDLSRHNHLQVIFTCQSLFMSNSDIFKSIVKNAHVVILMNSPRERNSILILFRQLFGNKSTKFAEFVLDEAQKESFRRYNHPYYDICLNLTPECNPNFRVLSDILSPYPLAYIKDRSNLK